MILWARQSRQYSKWRVENRNNRSISGFPGRGQQYNIIWDVQPPGAEGGGVYISLYSSSHWTAACVFLRFRASLGIPQMLYLFITLAPSFFLSASIQLSSCAVLTQFTEWTWNQMRGKEEKSELLYEQDKGKKMIKGKNGGFRERERWTNIGKREEYDE